MKNGIKKKLQARFKKLSSLDILGLFAIFFVTVSVYFFLGRKTEYLDVTVRLFNHDDPEYWLDSNQPKAWYIEHIQAGKAQKSALGEKLVEIVDVYSYPNGYVYNDVYVTLRLKTAQNKITKQYIYEGSPLLVHDVRSFRIQDVMLHGEIIDIDKKEKKLSKIKVIFELVSRNENFNNNSEALFKGIENHLADLISNGLTIRDSRGDTLIEITNVQKKMGEVIVANQNGLQKIPNPDLTQVFLETEMVVEKINNFYFYRKEESMIVDQSVYLTFDMVTVVGKITAIEVIEP